MSTSNNKKVSKAKTATKVPVVRLQYAAQYLIGLTMLKLDALCDDPARDVSGVEVQAILTPGEGGYTLSARDGEKTYPIIEADGSPVTFLSIEGALERLSDMVPYLSPQIVIDASKWFTLHSLH